MCIRDSARGGAVQIGIQAISEFAGGGILTRDAQRSETKFFADVYKRQALGAQPRDILRMALSEGMTLVAVGLGSGLVGALILTRFLRSLLYAVSPNDPLTFVALPALLAAVALLACLVPALRATQTDPLVALRDG